MKIKINKLKFNVLNDSKKKSKDKLVVVFLHGFTGSADDWKYFVDNIKNKIFPIAIDLIGHGKTSHPIECKYYSMTQIVEQLNNIFKALNLNRIILVGYSMGGRVALSYTIKYPKKIVGLILESTTAGIEKKNDKIARVNSDNKLAEMITKKGIEYFVKYWITLPLFKTQKKLYKNEYLNLIGKTKSNSTIGLANSLRGFGTGKMPSYWTKLSEIKQNVLLVTGQKDEKFTEINKKMVKLIPKSNLTIIKNAGHNTHLEKPQMFLTLIKRFILSLQNLNN
ncbi:MAG: 2-succinyl-6-hydroxy-2,4-cyclohexadiene-1-carboxylate synthase [Ignavibacteriales bacterium]|nr:2-succinyl-6-hydroxy-2,4-cyclohexadiene-1-carboxylate synthase [Ignavibacteriales bacterium]